MMLLTDDTTTIHTHKRHGNTMSIQESQGGRIVALLSSQFQPPYKKGCGTLCIHQHTLSMLLQQVGVEYTEKNVSVSVVLVGGDDHGAQRGDTFCTPPPPSLTPPSFTPQMYLSNNPTTLALIPAYSL